MPDEPCSCSTEGGNCAHKKLIAHHIIDNVFDTHSMLMRKRLKAAEAELQGFRDGSYLQSLEEKIRTLERKIAETDTSSFTMSITEKNQRLREQLNSLELRNNTLLTEINLLREDTNKVSILTRNIEEIRGFLNEALVAASEAVFSFISQLNEVEDTMPSAVQPLCSLPESLEAVSTYSKDLMETTVVTPLQLAGRCLAAVLEVRAVEGLRTSRSTPRAAPKGRRASAQTSQTNLTSTTSFQNHSEMPRPPSVPVPSPIPYAQAGSSIAKAQMSARVKKGVVGGAGSVAGSAPARKRNVVARVAAAS